MAPAWPWLALPLAAALVAYYLVQSALVELAIPLLTKQPVNRTWAKTAWRGWPLYVMGASVATAVAVLVDQRMWTVLPVVAASLAFGYRIYADYVERLEEGRQRREVIEFLEQGMSVLDRDSCVTLWNEAAERLVGCPRERVLGQPLERAVPAVGRTELPRAIKETLGDGKARSVAHVSIPSQGGSRILQVKVIAVAQGVTLLWHDITERTNAEHELKRTGERLALAAEGANDGLWQWNLQTQEFYVSGRWRAMIGLLAGGEHGTAAGVAGARASRRRRRSPSEARSAPRRAVRRVPARAPHPSRGRQLSPLPVPRRRGQRPRRQARAHRRLADRYHRAGDRPGAAAQRRLPRSAHGPLQPRGVRRRSRPPARRVPAAPRQQLVRGPLSRSRSLQDRQRQPRPPGRRSAAHRGLAPPRVLPASRRRASRGSAATSSPSCSTA